MTIIITLIVLSYAVSVIINIVQKKDYALDQKSGEVRTFYSTYFLNETTGEFYESW